MAAYFLALIAEINDPGLCGEYTEKAAPIVIEYGGEYLRKSTDLTPVGGDWEALRGVLIKFPDR
ncbi:MAG: DUF1330 domain-containing protein [Anaerolineales bacterium]|nr:DUF1330 domain-containing protein [Anaerolineales bacterium]